MESDVRFYRRRANEELAAANRAVTEAARERRLIMAGIFLERLEMLQSTATSALDVSGAASAFGWRDDAIRRS